MTGIGESVALLQSRSLLDPTGDAFGGSRSDHRKLTQPTRDTVAEIPLKLPTTVGR